MALKTKNLRELTYKDGHVDSTLFYNLSQGSAGDFLPKSWIRTMPTFNPDWAAKFDKKGIEPYIRYDEAMMEINEE